jgi:putative salt-induced outer membrane protein
MKKNPLDSLLLLFMLSAALVFFPSTPSSAGAQPGEEVPWKVRAELSYVSTSGNTDTQTLAGKLDTRKEGPINRYFAAGSYLRAADSGEETSDKLSIEGRYERVFTKRYFGLVTAGYLRDKFSGYDFRLYAGPGAGVELINTPAQRLQGLLSVLYNHDEFSRGVESTDDYLTAKVTGKYEWKVLENLTFRETLDYFTAVRETGRFFIDSVTAVEVKVNSIVSIGVNYTINYQNRPPSEDLRHTDTTLLTTLIIDF